MDTTIREFFDARAGRWDQITTHPPERVAAVLDLLGDISAARVLDVGSGTGVLLDSLLERVGPKGEVVALDLSPLMIEASRARHQGPNLLHEMGDFVSWRSSDPFDCIIAYSCFPHFLDPEGFWLSVCANLRSGGLLLVAHIEGRLAIDREHGGAASAISLPLPPVEELAARARSLGMEPVLQKDSEDSYFFLARR